MNLSEIRDLIRAEGKIQGYTESNALIDSIINQELLSLTGKSKYGELFTSAQFSPTDPEQNAFLLPTDFQLFESLTYNELGDPNCKTISLTKGRQGRHLSYTQGYPNYFFIAKPTFVVYPFSNVLAPDVLTLAYYRSATLVLDTDEVPVASLEKALIGATMSRMLRLVDTKAAQLSKLDANEAYRDSRAQDAAN